MAKKSVDGIAAISGIEVGHATDSVGLTGCTVVICRQGAVGGVDVRGSAPGTRETDLLRPENLVEKVHAVLLAGGSAFGLNGATGVVRYLEKHGIGYDAGVVCVPIVPAAVLFDLSVGDPYARPDAEMGYAACVAARSDEASQGNVGAGVGCSVGKLLGMGRAMKAGLGTAVRDAGGLLVGAIVAVNALGDVIDPATGQIVAGARKKVGRGFADSGKLITGLLGRTALSFAGNTVIGIVATNAKLTKAGANKVAQMAHDGLARAIRPAHTMMDGDAIFTMATCEKKAPVTLVGALAADAMAEAIVRGARAAEGIEGLPAAGDM